jgi:hypothetical protein
MYSFLRLNLFLSIVFLSALPTRADESSNYSIGPIASTHTVAGTYEPIEFTVPVHGPALNPFRSAEMALDAEITAPSGNVLRVPGFYSQDFKLENHQGVAIGDSAGWRIRFSGDEEGEYHCNVTLRVRGVAAASAPGPVFTLMKSSRHGTIRISRRSPRYFEFSDGTSYFAIGQNVCFTTDVTKSIPNAHVNAETLPWDAAYSRWFGKMSENGANWTRIWMRPNFYLEAGEPWQWSLENAWRLDHIVDLAQERGIYLCLCFNSERDDEGTCYKGHLDPFRASNTAWGALLKSRQKKFVDFCDSEEAREMYRDKIRYIVARWGASPNIFCWELWNEIECLESNGAEQWAADMTAYLRQIDPWRHLIKSSAHGPQSKQLWTPAFGDFNDVHGYFGWSGEELPKNLGSFLPAFSSRVRAYDRPFLVGETGIAREADTKYGLSGDLQDRDTTCLSVHEGLWGGLFSGAAGSGMPWWWDEHVDLRNGYYRFRAIANFVKDIPFNEEAFVCREKPDASASPLIVFELAGRDHRLLWVRHPQLSWFNEAVENKPRTPIDATLSLQNMQEGVYEVEIWDTDRGEIESTTTLQAIGTKLEIPLKGVAKELAIKVKQKDR